MKKSTVLQEVYWKKEPGKKHLIPDVYEKVGEEMRANYCPTGEVAIDILFCLNTRYDNVKFKPLTQPLVDLIKQDEPRLLQRYLDQWKTDLTSRLDSIDQEERYSPAHIRNFKVDTLTRSAEVYPMSRTENDLV